MITRKNKIALTAATIITVFVAFAAADFYLTTPQQKPAPKPFRFSLAATPDNVNIIQGGNATITVEAAYLDGNVLPITLSAGGGPNGIIYQFSNQTGTPATTQPFRSNLTIFVPSSVDSGSYLIAISSNAGAQTCQAAFNLTVLDAEIKVSGTVTMVSQINISGKILDVIPTDILFESNTTGQTYQAKVQRFTDTSIALGKTGNYSITLPNQQSYYVEFYCFSFPHYIPVPRVASGGTEDGYFTIECGAGVNSKIANFIG